VGTERSAEPDTARLRKSTRRENVDLVVGGGSRTGRPGRRIDIAAGEEESKGWGKSSKSNKPDPGDDPLVPLKTSYFERVKMDRYAGQIEFEIKSSAQVLVSIFSFFSHPVDYLNPRFVNRRMNEYYKKLEQLVTSTRTLLPRNNAKRAEQLKRISPFGYNVVNIFRNWDIEGIDNDMAKIQAHPRTVKMPEIENILRAIYKPLFILENLDIENHIKGAFKLLYKILYIESPMDAKEKYQDVIRNALAAFSDIRRDIQYCLYPALMKCISDHWIPYERFFIARRRRFMAFLNVTEQDRLNGDDLNLQQMENVDAEVLKGNITEDAEAQNLVDVIQEDPNDPKVIARKAQEEAARAESKALDRGRAALEALFPQAGWDKLEEYPDLYPYFAEIYNLKRGYELIAPTDPIQQISILMHILEDIFFAMRYVRFATITGPDGNLVNIEGNLSDIINNWRGNIDVSFVREYLPRLTEYCRILENSAESRISPYAKKIVNELHWIKRLYFLPYYRFEAMGPPTFQKQDILSISNVVRMLRRYLTSIAMGIEQGTRQGGAEAKAPCNGISNPWEPYKFEVPNPVSRRLDMLLAPGKRNNASLVFFSLSAVTVLDYIINNEDSWAYANRPGPLFRSLNDEGVTPLFGVENKLDADKIFKDSLKKKG